MKTAFTLEPPFSEKWSKGYMVTNPEGRRTIILYNSDRDRSSVSYARYLMSVHLGRFLLKNEQVDHIDNDKTHDILTNLQILSPSENTQKSAKPPKVLELMCGWCNTSFRLEAKQLHKKRAQAPCCSRSCAAKLHNSLTI